MKKQRRVPLIPLAIILAALIGGGLYWWHQHGAESNAPAAGGPAASAGEQGQRGKGARRGAASGSAAPVQAAVAREQSVPQFLSGLGTVTAASTATVRSRVEGDLLALHFTEGQEVKAGQLLAEIDPRPYQVALTQAQGQLAKDQATLANARRDLARYEKLAKTSLVSQQELDTQRALVSESLGTLKADQGSVASAELNLSYSRVTAPIAGRVGLKQVDVGNYISAGDTTGIVVITQTHPIDLIFTLPESDIASVLSAQKNGEVSVEAWDRSNSSLLTRGRLLSLDNQIDTTTGTVKVKARFDNQDDKLFPNQFVNARLQASTLENAIVIPPAGLQMGSEGHFVWVVNSEGKVSKKAVTAGFQDSEKAVITNGLNAGEQVVTDGIDRLTDGAKVEVVAPQSTPLTSARHAQPAKGASD